MRPGALLLALLLLSPARGEAQVVVGRVTAEAGGITLPSVSVSLVDASYESVAQTLTDSAGRYSLRAPLAGNYRVVADHLGYLRLETPLATIAADRTFTVDFELPVDPIEVDGLRVEVERRAEVKRRLTQYGVRLETLGARYVPQAEIEEHENYRDFGEVLIWQNLAGIRVLRVEIPPDICVQAVAGRERCALMVLDGQIIDGEYAASVPLETLGAIAVLSPTEATLSFGTDGGGGAVLLFTRSALRPG